MQKNTNSREHCLLCCNAVHFEDSSVFRRYISAPSSGSKSTPRNKSAETKSACRLLLLVSGSSETWRSLRTTRHYKPEERTLDHGRRQDYFRGADRFPGGGGSQDFFPRRAAKLPGRGSRTICLQTLNWLILHFNFSPQNSAGGNKRQGCHPPTPAPMLLIVTVVRHHIQEVTSPVILVLLFDNRPWRYSSY